MGFLDSVSSTFNRGTAAAERATRSAKLKGQVNSINRQRQDLAAQLGASLYDATKDDPQWHVGREALYDQIAACDRQRDSLQAELVRIEQEAADAEQMAQFYTCPQCGARFGATDLFCSGCGLPADQVKQAYAAPDVLTAAPDSGLACPQCGTPVGPDDIFCVSCGASLQQSQEPQEPQEQ